MEHIIAKFLVFLLIGLEFSTAFSTSQDHSPRSSRSDRLYVLSKDLEALLSPDRMLRYNELQKRGGLGNCINGCVKNGQLNYIQCKQMCYCKLTTPASNLGSSKGINLTEHAVNISTDCIILEHDQLVPWDNPDGIVSFQTEDAMRKLKNLVFLPLMSLIGCPANVINMVIFYKQGLRERINVCLFALSMADEVYLISNLLWFGEQLVLQFTTKEIYGPVLKFMVNNYLTGFHGFIWISQAMSAIIASDRCYCILQPLRAQTALRTSTMVYIVVAVHMVILSFSFILITRYHVTCAYDPITKQTTAIMIPGEFYLQHEEFILYLDVFVFGVGVPGAVILIVVMTTVVTMIKLRHAAAWRASTSSGNAVSQRDIALTKMLVANSIFFLICAFPFVVFRLMFLLMPEVSTGRREHNFYMMIQWLLQIITFTNSTCNIVVYYSMGSRFRETFWQLFGRRRAPNKR